MSTDRKKEKIQDDWDDDFGGDEFDEIEDEIEKEIPNEVGPQVTESDSLRISQSIQKPLPSKDQIEQARPKPPQIEEKNEEQKLTKPRSLIKKTLAESELDRQIERDTKIERQPMKAELKLELEEALDALQLLMRKNRRRIYEFFSQAYKRDQRILEQKVKENELYLEHNEDDIMEGVEVKRMKFVKIEEYITYTAFKKILRDFGFEIKEEIIRLVCMKLFVFHKRLQAINFSNLLRRVYKFQSIIDLQTQYFKPVKEKNREAMTPQNVVIAIQRTFRNFKKRQAEKEKMDADKKYARFNKEEIDITIYKPAEIVKLLRDRLKDAGTNPKDLVHIHKFDEEDQIDFKRFYHIVTEELRFSRLSKAFLHQVFEAIDKKRLETISYKVFLDVLYGKNAESIIGFPKDISDVVEMIRDAAASHFSSSSKFINFCQTKTAGKITHDDLYPFLKSFTRLDQDKALEVYNYLNNDNLGYITSAQLLRLYESSRKSSRRMSRRSGEDERFKSFLDISGFGGGGGGLVMPSMGFNNQGSIMGEDRIDEGGLGSVAPDGGIAEEFSVEHNRHISKDVKDQIEALILDLSISVYELIKFHGKSRKDLFQMFADKLTKMMNVDEFMEAVKFILKKEDAEENVITSCYYLFAWPTSKKITYSKFCDIIEMGKKMNPLYIKVKHRYSDFLDKYRALYSEELQKMTLKDSDGFVPFSDVVRLFNINKIELTEIDCEFLKGERAIIQKDRQSFVDINLFMKKVFPHISVFDTFTRERSATKLQRYFRKYKSQEGVRKQQDQLLEMLGGGDSEGFGFDTTPKTPIAGKRLKKKGKTKKGKNLQIIDEKESKITKPAEIFDIAKTSFDNKNFNRRFSMRTQIEDKMNNVLFPRRSSILGTKARQEIEKAIKSILNDVINTAVSYGESLQLSKKVQRRYTKRPVTKDVFVVINESYFDVVNVIPQSLSHFNDIGRLIYLSDEGTLFQYDIINRNELPVTNLSSRIPSKKTKILDYLLNSESGQLYILKKNWDLELWEIFQEKRSPKTRVRLIQELNDDVAIDSVFKNRHLGMFPKLLSLSEGNEYLVVNTTLRNTSLLILDPNTLSILNQMIFKLSDFYIPDRIYKIYHALKPIYERLSKEQLTFEKIFNGEFKVEDDIRYIPRERFVSFIWEQVIELNLVSEIASGDVRQLAEYIDQNGDKQITDSEWLHVAEQCRYSKKTSQVHATCEIPSGLQNISLGAANILTALYEFVREKDLNLKEALAIFDSDRSGKISVEEFFIILDEIARESSLEDKRIFFDFVDRDGDGFIQIQEFEQLFKLFGNYSIQELLPSENPRNDIFNIVERSYTSGIDLELKLQEFDEFNEGSINPKSFRYLMKSLPFGLGDKEIDYFFENSLDFTNTGNVNYINLINTEKFRRIKFVYYIEKGMKEFVDQLTTSNEMQRFTGMNKILIENVIYITSLDIIIFTTTNPKTSTIYLAQLKEKTTKKTSKEGSLLEQYQCNLMARLEGHKSGEPPTIYYAKESGCLISGEKYPSKAPTLNQNLQSNNRADPESIANKFYTNIATNKTRSCDIMIWNLDKELYQMELVNPPWTISPTRIIKNAHYNSIISITYMKSNQLIVSSSTDGSIKFWDPVAKPYLLTHKDSLQQLKPGYYTTLEQEETQTSSAFGEVRRIYTGDLTCYNLCPIFHRASVKKDDHGIPEFYDVEYLASIELGKPQKISGKLRSQGILKLYGIERMSLEIPVCRYEEPIPRQLWEELEELAIKNREIAKLRVKRALPRNLEKLNSSLVIYNNSVHKIGRFLKNISLKRFTGADIETDIKQLFEFLIGLPFRDKRIPHGIMPISEIHMHLKKNGTLFPKNIGKEAFLEIVKAFIKKGSRYLVDQRLKNDNLLYNKLSELIVKNQIDIDDLFTRETYTWIDLKKELAFLGCEPSEFEEFFSLLDPFYSNIIEKQSMKDLFSSELVEARMKLFARPNFIFSKLNSLLSKSNKMTLLRNLFEADEEGMGRIGAKSFTAAFAGLSKNIDEIIIKELFDLLSEENHEGDVYLSLSLFCKKLLTYTENFELARVYNVLAKIKNSLRFRMLTLEHIFMENEQEFKGKSIKSLSISLSAFRRKIKELKVPGVKQRDVDICAYFLSTADEQGSTCIAYTTIQSYFRKVDMRFQYMQLGDYKMLVEECSKILEKKEEFQRKWKKISRKDLIGFAEMRMIFTTFGIEEDIIDLMLIKFAETEISSQLFLNKIQSFCEMNSFLSEPKRLSKPEIEKLSDEVFKESNLPKINISAPEPKNGAKEAMEHDVVDELVEYVQQYESDKSVQACLEVCKKFDEENTGRIAVADFANIISYNLLTGSSILMESLLIKLQKDFLVTRGLPTIEYAEVFDKISDKQLLKDEASFMEEENHERNLTELIADFYDHLHSSNFALDKAFNFFDRDKLGFILFDEFEKILNWLRFDMTEKEAKILLERISSENAIEYRKLDDLMTIHSQHINVRFDIEIWMVYGKKMNIEVLNTLNRNIDNIGNSLYSGKKDIENPLLASIVLEDILKLLKNELTNEDVQDVLRYAVIGSANTISKAVEKIQAKDFDWRYENIHVDHFLSSIPIIWQKLKELPENKVANRDPEKKDSQKNEVEGNRIVNKVKMMLRTRGVTMWESLLSCSVSVIEKSKLMKNDFLRMMRIMNLDLTMKEKSLLLNVLIGNAKDKTKIDLNQLLTTFESEPVTSNKSAGQTLLLEKMIYGLYYAGYSLGRAFDYMDEKKNGFISRNDFIVGLTELDLGLSVFEINQILEILGFEGDFARIMRGEFKKKMKLLMQKNSINLLQNFSLSLLARIQYLIDQKHMNLLESFQDLDQYRTRTADLKMLRKALTNFGLANIRKHEIKTLIKMYKSDITALDEQQPQEIEEKEEDNKDKTLSLDFGEVAPQEQKVKKFNIEDENFKIDYKEFVEKIYDMMQINYKLFKGSYQVIRKVYNMTKVKGLTIFETFVYFDVNNLNQVSNMEVRLGLQNLEIPLDKFEIDSLWKVFEKNQTNKINFHSYFSAFMNAGCIDIIKFDDKVHKVTKKFVFLLSKHGNSEELFRRFDRETNGYVHLDHFRGTCEELRLNLSEDEIEAIFKVLCSPAELGDKKLKAMNMTEGDQSDGSMSQKRSQRSFNFKRFATVVSYFRKRDYLNHTLHKLNTLMQEKGISLKQLFRDYLNNKTAKKRKNAADVLLGKKRGIPIGDLKDTVKGLELGLNSEELNSIVDAFEVEIITLPLMERVVRIAVTAIERESNQKNDIFSKVINELQDTLLKENMALQRIFFDFDTRSDGTLSFEEFHNMFNFLNIRLNKKELKIVFDEIDFEGKGFINYKEFQSFFDSSLFHQNKVDEVDESDAKTQQLDGIIKKMQEAAVEEKSSLEKIILSANMIQNNVVSQSILEKLLLDMNCVLKREEIKKIIDAASRDGACSYRDLIDWGIKNKIDSKAHENAFPQFPPAVQVILAKMLQIFRKLDMNNEAAFNYFSKEKKDFTLKHEFLILVQGLQIQTNEEELIGLYNFFDERNYTEISKNSFLEKCELASNFYKWSQQDGDKQKQGKMTLTLRQHVMSALEKIHSFFMEKKFNKTQIYAVFDKNGTGMISREDFIEMIEKFKIQIPLEHIRSALNFLDPQESGVISITQFIKKMVEAVPDHSKNTYRNSQALATLGSIISTLKVHLEKFTEEFLELEKKLQISDIMARSKTGVPIYDFYRLLSTYGVRLKENEKILLNSSFANKKKKDYFDTEMLYLSIERVAGEAGAFKSVEGEDMEYWETQILKKVANRLRSMNLTLEKAFEEIDSNKYGLVQKVDFKQLLLSLQIDLSQRDIDLILKRLATKQNPNLISLKEFRQRFWACFFEGKSQLHPLNIDNRSRQIAAMFLHKIKFDLQMPLTDAWDKLDRGKLGIVRLNDLKDFLVEIGMPINKQDLGFLFNLIDGGADGEIDQYEFAEFWNLNLPADFELRKQKAKKLEMGVLGKISRYINRKALNLSLLFKKHDIKNQGYLQGEELGQLFAEVGINVSESTASEIMKLISPDSPQRVYFSNFETSLLRNGLKYVSKKGIMIVKFHHKLVDDFFNSLNIAANKQKINVHILLKQFDHDYNGYLEREEFYNLLRSFDKNFSSEDFQRLAHVFCNKENNSQISIEVILQKQKGSLINEERGTEGHCDLDVFNSTLQHFDPTVQLFKKWSLLRQAYHRFERYMRDNKDSLRGLRLISLQAKISQIKKRIKEVQSDIRLSIAFLKNKASKLISEHTRTRFIDSAYNDILEKSISLDLEEHLLGDSDEITSSQQFQLHFDSLLMFNKHVKLYSAEVLIVGRQPSWAFLYPHSTLRMAMRNGKFYEEHLRFEIQLHRLLREEHPDKFTKIYGVYEKQIGVEADDKDLIVFHEVLSDEWVTFSAFISSTGGLLRIPFLMASNAISKVINFWFRKILEIVDIVNQNGAALYWLRPENFYVNTKTLEVKLASLRGVVRIGDDGTIELVSDRNVLKREPVETEEDKELYFKKIQEVQADGFIPPELFYESELNYTKNIDGWCLGAFLYFMIFGEQPRSLSAFVSPEILKKAKEPSDYIFFDFLNEENLELILSHDYDSNIVGEDKIFMVHALDKLSYQGIFDKFIIRNQGEEKIEEKGNEPRIGEYIDMIMLLMSWKPYDRPSPRVLLNSRLFSSDTYQFMQMRQFASIAFFYRSPSKSVRVNILLPLRQLSTVVIRYPHEVVALTADLIRMIDGVIECLHLTSIFSVEKVKEEFSKELMGTSAMFSTQLMDEVTTKINKSRRMREKNPNYAIVKFMFNYYVFDILLFLVLRHHTAVNEQIAGSSEDVIDYDQLENKYYAPVKGFKLIMQKLIYELRSYEGSSSPFVGHVLELSVKFAIGEEFCLMSEMLGELEEDINLYPKLNFVNEYKSISDTLEKRQISRFFNPTIKRDETDTYWLRSLSRDPYCFKSNNWSLYLNSLATNLLREALGDGGLGSANHPVILDYVRFITEKRRSPSFEGDSSIRFFNSMVSEKRVKSVDYFNEIFVLCKNIVTLNDPSSGFTSLKVAVNYVKTIITAKNIDRVRAILDSRIMIKCLTYLQAPDIGLRTAVLELVKIVSNSNSREHLHLFEGFDIASRFDNIKDMKPRSIDEIQKNFGLVTHLLVSKEDNMNKDNFIQCVRGYFEVYSRISDRYMRQIINSTLMPSFTLALLSSLKDKSEILQNKVIVLEIIRNLTNGSYKVLANLSHSTLDTWRTCGRLLAVRGVTNRNKVNDYLLPYSAAIFKNVLIDSRSEFTGMFERVVGLGSLLRDQKMILPQSVTLGHLADLVQDAERFFQRHLNGMIEEINAFVVTNMSNEPRSKLKKIKKFEQLLSYAVKRICCWLYFESRKVNEYNISLLQDIVFMTVGYLQNYYDQFSEYSSISNSATNIMIICAKFFETLVNLKFEYLYFDIVNEERGKINLEWILLQIYNIYNYHILLELDNEPEEQEKLAELRINRIEDMEQRGKELVHFIKNSASLRKYSRNRAVECGHAFLRMLLEILELNDPKYNSLLESARFGFFYSGLLQKQFSIMQLFIETKTENIHVIGVNRYVEESNLRLRIFEAILAGSSESIQNDLLESQCIQRIPSSLLRSYSEFDVGYYRSNYKFLPFRTFMPFRAEGACMVSIIIWNKDLHPRIYSELINECIKANTFEVEGENVRQKSNKLRKLSAMNILSRLIKADDKQVMFLLRKKYTLELIAQELQENDKLALMFKETKALVENYGVEL